MHQVLGVLHQGLVERGLAVREDLETASDLLIVVQQVYFDGLRVVNVLVRAFGVQSGLLRGELGLVR